MPQPQAQIKAALGNLDAAIKREPELQDVATLKHARSLVQRVYDKNRTEGGYAGAISRALTTTKG